MKADFRNGRIFTDFFEAAFLIRAKISAARFLKREKVQ
jgi:hypothetical protein